jgi:hypothetical protein
MELSDFAPLLRLAEIVQARIKQENDQVARTSLEDDLKRIKDEIGKVVLGLPQDVELFSKPRDFDQESHLSGTLTLGEELSSTGPPRPLTLPAEALGAKFNAFLKSKSTHRSRIPVPTDA